jgi:hypothetical protein
VCVCVPQGTGGEGDEVNGRLEVSEGIDLLNRGEGKGRLEETTATHRTTVDSWLGEPFRDALLAEVMLAWQANWSFHRIVAYRAVLVLHRLHRLQSVGEEVLLGWESHLFSVWTGGWVSRVDLRRKEDEQVCSARMGGWVSRWSQAVREKKGPVTPAGCCLA